MASDVMPYRTKNDVVASGYRAALLSLPLTELVQSMPAPWGRRATGHRFSTSLCVLSDQTADQRLPSPKTARRRRPLSR
jgi:hypothetical protein